VRPFITLRPVTNGSKLRCASVVRRSTTTNVDTMSENTATPYKVALHLPLPLPRQQPSQSYGRRRQQEGGEATAGYAPRVVSPPPLVVSSAAQTPHVTSSAPLLLFALSSLCSASWLLPVVLPLLLVSLPLVRPCQRPRRTGVVAVVALASLPIVAAATALVHCRHQLPSPPATATVECHLPLTIASP